MSSFHLKGSGWYVTDYGGKKAPVGEAKKVDAAKSETTDTVKTETTAKTSTED
jgi:predicted nucleic acid-binding Zn ribbon protein